MHPVLLFDTARLSIWNHEIPPTICSDHTKQFKNPPFSYHVETRNVFILSSLAYQHVYMVICIYINMFTRSYVTTGIPVIFRSIPKLSTSLSYLTYKVPGTHGALIFQLNTRIFYAFKIEPVPVKGLPLTHPRLQLCTVLDEKEMDPEEFILNHPVEECKKSPPADLARPSWHQCSLPLDQTPRIRRIRTQQHQDWTPSKGSTP